MKQFIMVTTVYGYITKPDDVKLKKSSDQNNSTKFWLVFFGFFLFVFLT